MRTERGPSFLPDGKRVVYTRSTGKVRQFPGGEQWIQHSDIVVRDVNGANPRVVIRSRPYGGDYLWPTSRRTGRGSSTTARTRRLRSRPAGVRSSWPVPTAAVSAGSRRGRSTPATTPTGLPNGQADRLPIPSEQLRGVSGLRRPAGRQRSAAAHAVQAGDERPLLLLLARREVDHVLQVGPRRAAGHLRHASERNRDPAGHTNHALGQRTRLGVEVSQRR